MKTWCCQELKKNITLTVDSQDIREIYNGKCPYCDKPAKIGKRLPKGRLVKIPKVEKLPDYIIDGCSFLNQTEI